MSLFKSSALALAVATSTIAVGMPAAAQTSVEQAQTGGAFVQKSKTLKGSYEIVQRDGKTYVSFSDDFKAKKGPDLKIFLSPQTIESATGKTAIDGALNIGELKKTKGAQEYELPAGLTLSDYKSVLVHCEAYSILWGGSNL